MTGMTTAELAECLSMALGTSTEAMYSEFWNHCSQEE